LPHVCSCILRDAGYLTPGTLFSKGYKVRRHFFLQNNGRNSRWLSGTRSGDGEKVLVRDFNSKNYELEKVFKSYKWKVRSNPYTFGNERDPKQGDCVKYGDTIFLQNHEKDADRMLSGSRGTANEGVLTRNVKPASKEVKNLREAYEWRIQSVLGNGFNSKDPTRGICVQEDSIVFLQNMF
jgi:hypothetical protein